MVTSSTPTPEGDGGAAPAWVSNDDPDTEYDVVIVGGGLAGLCLALQLRRSQPQATVAVLERRPLPAPSAAFKVGESSNEIAEWYWNNVLGLGRLLATSHIRKLGLRYFCSSGTNDRFVDRLEIGSRSHMFSSTYQVDRGQFENQLAECSWEAGAAIFDNCRVVDVELTTPRHRVFIDRAGRCQEIRARWVVDASGRRGILKRKLDLDEAIGHEVNAAWFRLGEPIAMDDLETELSWKRRVPESIRWKSTNHLLGRGYWVWLIPLASGSLSVGIVADPRSVLFGEFSKFDKFLAWLHAHEPVLGAAVETRRASLQDFHALRHLAFGCRRVFSPDRWALTGEAGVFLDPLYSPGSDFIALSNMYITDLIQRDLAGDETFRERADRASELYLRQFVNAVVSWRDQYQLLGSSVIWPAKTVWDNLGYFSILAPAFINGGTYDIEFMTSIRPLWQRFHQLNAHMQWFLRDWDDHIGERQGSGFLNMSNDCVRWFNAWLVVPVGKDRLAEHLERNTDFMERLAVRLMALAARTVGWELDPDAIDPYRFAIGGAAPHDHRSPYRDRLLSHPHPEMIAGLVRRVESLWQQTSDRMGVMG